MDVDIRYLPNQDPGEILGQVRAIGDLEILRQVHPRAGDRLAHATPTSSPSATRSGRSIEGDALSVGRDGASDAISFLEAGIPAVPGVQRVPGLSVAGGTCSFPSVLWRRAAASGSKGFFSTELAR